jgi:PAS domain S-box-containing protein
MDEGIKVLYVDDEPALLEITRLFLEENGNFLVTTLTSAKEALDSPIFSSYDLILSDYLMPGIDGIAFLKEVRKRYGDLPFILFTGRGREDVVIEAINNGADFYLQKGGDPTAQFAELAHQIRHAVKRKRSELSRMKAEQALREREELLMLFIQHAPAALAMFDREMRYIAASRRWMADYYLGDRDLTGLSHYEIFPELTEEIREVHRRGLAGEIISANEDKFERKDGSVQYLAWEVRPWYTASREIGGVIIFSEDITQRKTTEIALKSLVRSMVGTTGVDSLRRITENLSSWLNADCVMIGEIEPDEKTVRVLSMLLDGKEVNDFTYTLEGTPCGNVADKGFCLYPDNAARLFPRSRDLAELNIRGYIGTPMRNYEGRVIGIICALFRNPVKTIPPVQEIMDIMAVKAAAEIERKRAEETLKKSHHVLETILNTIPARVFWKDTNLTYIGCNTAFARDAGFEKPEEVIGKDDYMMGWRDQAERYRADDRLIIESGNAKLLIEEPQTTPSGEQIYLLTSKVPMKDTKGETIGVLGTYLDITQRKRAEDALRHANKNLNLLSRITRHDIMNQLLTLDSFIVLLRKHIPDPSYEHYFSRIITASSLITKLIQFTKEYEKLGSTGPVWQDIEKISGMVAVGILPQNVHLTIHTGNIEIFADPMLIRVMYNLFDNATGHGDHVTEIAVRFIEGEKTGTLIVEDNGIGVPADIKEQIFERGFGSKTGIGLFLAREILAITDITIQETGEPGKGARFEIRVPKGAWRKSGKKE